ncbi:hypothetical protein [Pleomorphomonas sp. PLEO]|uniref:hypothetical protein n=1 Tax=Pleomorphomonas sp. PLEO TaxID=3239306 RepID=UPI00351E9A87
MTITCDGEQRISTKRFGRTAIYAAASLALAAVCLASPAEARVPPFAAACPGRIDVQADNGGRILINGQPARVRAFNNRSYEARLGPIVVAVNVGPGGRLDVSSRGRMCQVRPPRMEPMAPGGAMPPMMPGDGPGRPMPPMQGDAGGRPGDNGPMDQMAAACRGEAAAQFRVRPSDIMTSLPAREGRRFVVQGSFRDRGGRDAPFACMFDGNGRLISVR